MHQHYITALYYLLHHCSTLLRTSDVVKPAGFFVDMKTFYLKAIRTALLLAIEARGPSTPFAPRGKPPANPGSAPKTGPQSLSQPSALPTTEERHRPELRRRLGKELYRMELDLMGGGRIAAKPCDCLSHKHTLGLEATTGTTTSYTRMVVLFTTIDGSCGPQPFALP